MVSTLTYKELRTMSLSEKATVLVKLLSKLHLALIKQYPDLTLPFGHVNCEVLTVSFVVAINDVPDVSAGFIAIRDIVQIDLAFVVIRAMWS